MPAQPMATSVRPRRHVRPKVSLTMTRDVDARRRPEAVADAPGRAVGVLRQQRGVAALDVRQVDAGVGAHEAVLGLADDEVAPAPQDPHRLALDERLVAQRIVGVDRHEQAFGLRHDLLRDHEDVAVVSERPRCAAIECGEVVADVDLADALDAEDRRVACGVVYTAASVCGRQRRGGDRVST